MATEEQCARMEFKPWKKYDYDLEVFGGENWHNHGVYVRLAYALKLMSRDEMIEFHRDTDGDQVDLLFANLFDTAEFLKYVAAMAESALGRMMASGCAAIEQGVIGDGKRPVRLEGFQTRPTWFRAGNGGDDHGQQHQHRRISECRTSARRIFEKPCRHVALRGLPKCGR